MSIHVMIKRRWRIGDPGKLFPLLHELRDKAKEQAGFLSNQILRSADKHETFLVISRWESLDDWNKWQSSQVRRDLQAQIDSLIGEKTFYEIYETVDDKGETLCGKR